jgi:hypothetical protein
MAARSLLAVALLSAIAPAFAQEDLTLPPELRSSAPNSAQDAPSVDAKHRDPATTKRTAAQKQAAAPARDPGSAAATPKHPEEDPISLGMSWKANNTAVGATWATSRLPQENKNHPDEAAGAGGLVGLKYKF